MKKERNMAMTPEERQEFDRYKAIVDSLASVENVPFIENIKRRTATGLKTDGTTSASSISIAVRNAADDGSETVTKQPDTKLKIVDLQGNTYYLPAFNS